MKVTTSVTIGKPVNQVFNYFMNPNNYSSWQKGFKRFEQVSGSPQKAGSKSKHIYEEEGKEIILNEEVVSYIKEKEYSERLFNKEMEILMTSKFLSSGKATKVEVTSDIHVKPIWHRIFTLYVAHVIKRYQSQDFLKLKFVLEKGK